MRRAAIYARFSSRGQREESIEGQERVGRDFAARNDLTVVKVYADRALTGRNDHRPQFLQMIEDAKRRKFDVLIVYDNERFARNKYDATIYRHQLRKAGVEILYSAGLVIQGPEGVMVESLMDGLAEYFSLDLARKVKRGIHENALKGMQSGGTVPYGYKLVDKKLVADDTEVLGVRRMYDYFIAGLSYKEISDKLIAEGFRPRRGDSFKRDTILRVVTSRRYIGEFRFDGVVIPEGTPALVSQEIFDAAQAEAQRRGRSRRAKAPTGRYLLATKLFCAECGRGMVGVSGTNRAGVHYQYYYCPNHKGKKKTCSTEQVRADAIERVVVDATREYMLTPERMKTIARKLVDIQSKDADRSMVDFYASEIKRLTREISNLISALASGVVSDEITRQITARERQRADIEAALAREKAATFTFTEAQFFSMLSIYSDADAEKIISTFVHRVELDNNTVTIWFNLTDPHGEFEHIKKVFEQFSGWRTRCEIFKHAVIIHGWAVIRVLRP